MDKKEQTMHDPSQCSMTEAGCVCVCVCVCVQAKGTEHVVSKPFKADQPSNNNPERNKEKGIHKVHK